jgi:hypothetical protein
LGLAQSLLIVTANLDTIIDLSLSNARTHAHAHASRHIFLENVQGFIGSAAMGVWQRTLKEAGYTYATFCISPTSLGVCNHRTRHVYSSPDCFPFVLRFGSAISEHLPYQAISEHLPYQAGIIVLSSVSRCTDT